jgi:hypothetical protein
MNERIEKLFENVKVNEQIERLAKESGCTIDKLGYGEGNLEKFAELIVRECLSIVDSNNPRPPGTTIMYSLAKDEYFDTGWQVAVETKSNQIKQHFGVEE